MDKQKFMAFLNDETNGKPRACRDAREWVENTKRPSFESCNRPDWLLWMAGKAGADRKVLVRIACECARLALVYVADGEDRPRLAIEAAEAWLDGKMNIEDVRNAATDAANAAYATDAANAAYAAYAAANAAAYATDAATDAANAADAATYAAYAAYAADAVDAVVARKKVTAACLAIVQKHITWEMIVELIEKEG